MPDILDRRKSVFDVRNLMRFMSIKEKELNQLLEIDIDETTEVTSFISR